LAGSGLRLPRRTEIEVDPRLINPTAWYLQTHDEAGLTYFKRDSNQAWSGSGDFTTASLEDLLNQIHDNVALTSHPMTVRPTKLIVHPDMAARAQYVLTHEPTLGERLWWWLSNSEYRNA